MPSKLGLVGVNGMADGDRALLRLGSKGEVQAIAGAGADATVVVTIVAVVAVARVQCRRPSVRVAWSA